MQSDHLPRQRAVCESSEVYPFETTSNGQESNLVTRVISRSRHVAVGVGLLGAFGIGVVVGGGGIADGHVAVAESSLVGSPEFKTLEDTWDLIHEQWALPEKLDDSKLIYGAAQGMVDAIGDEGHSAFLDPEMTLTRAEQSQSEFVGIGVDVTSRCGVPEVLSTISGSPAEKSGLKQGDIIIEVDGAPTRKMDISGLREAILGAEGDSLTLTIERPGVADPIHVDVVRATIPRRQVTWNWLPEKTAHLQLTAFDPGVNSKLRNSLREINNAGAERLILDLRGNPGGLVTEVIGVASEFLPEGSTIFQEQSRDGSIHAKRTVGQLGSWLEKPLIVLIDGESASGAEVLAAALRDNGRAELIGETTFGTGTVISTFPQDDGSSVMLGTAFWLTPAGDLIWGVGVDPDEFVTLAPDAFPARPEDDPDVTVDELSQLADRQLQAAFAALNVVETDG